MDDLLPCQDICGSEEVGLGMPDSRIKLTREPYGYESLAGKPPDTFRVLLLEPGNRTDPLKGSLFEARKSDGVDYAALSYLWGETNQPSSISIDGKHLSIGTNLSMFLKHLRHTNNTLALWTDAVCIDQENLGERGHQVRLMGDIYRSATDVYAWLGEETYKVATLTSFFSSQKIPHTSPQSQEASRAAKDSTMKTPFKTRARNAARYLMARRNPIVKPETETNDNLFKNVVEFEDPLGFNAVASKIAHKKDAFLVFLDLCKRPYWMRTWIVQELLLGQSVIICIGEVRIEWEDFSTIIDKCAMEWSTVIGWKIPEEMNSVQNLIEMMEMPLENRYNPLEELLQRYSNQKCLDSRDRIYGLLSLAKDCDKIVPDYALNRLDLFFSIERHSTKSSGP
jgi:hypothetical protein